MVDQSVTQSSLALEEPTKLLAALLQKVGEESFKLTPSKDILQGFSNYFDVFLWVLSKGT